MLAPKEILVRSAAKNEKKEVFGAARLVCDLLCVRVVCALAVGAGGGCAVLFAAG